MKKISQTEWKKIRDNRKERDVFLKKREKMGLKYSGIWYSPLQAKKPITTYTNSEGKEFVFGYENEFVTIDDYLIYQILNPGVLEC